MKTLKLILVVSFITITTNIFGQDTIVTKDGQEIKSKVTEIGSNLIKYKMYNNQEGPIYTINKSELVFISLLRSDIALLSQNGNIAPIIASLFV